MDIDIKIGREESGPNTIQVPETSRKVSRHHAVLHWKEGVVTIEDNESANGTFVNGKRVAKTKVGENDTVWLGGNGGEECYQIDMKKIFDSCRLAEKKTRTDYTKEFEDLKQAYIEYKEAEAKLKNGQNIKQRIVSFIPMLAGGLCAIFGAVGFIGTGLGVIATLILLSRSSKHDIAEDITELQIKYQPRYCCPKCGQKYPFTTHWKKLAAEGKCPNPKCDAQFVKQ